MSSHFIFPKPKGWDIFEDIVCDVVSRKFNSRNLQRYGRSGQKQFGVDIVGFTRIGLTGVQCKHHPKSSMTSSEVDKEIKNADGFQPPLNEFIIITSADRDSMIHSYVLRVSKARKEENIFPISILFWQDIYNWLVEYPDLMFKHFTKYFSLGEMEKVYLLPINEQVRMTSRWPVSTESLKDNINQMFGGLTKVDPYKVAVGFTTFQDVSFTGAVDIEVALPELFNDGEYSEHNFLEAARILSNVKTVLKDPYFARDIRFNLQSRLSAAFLLGWVFRKVTHFNLEIIQNDQMWVTKGLPYVPSRLYDFLPILNNVDGNEVVMVLNISRNIEEPVRNFIENWTIKPKVILAYGVEGNQILSPAHALSVASEVSKKIKNVMDRWQVKHLHIFSAMPAGLATLISFNLNAICPISLYHFDDSRTKYKLGGILTNNI